MQPYLAYIMPVSGGRPDQGLPGMPGYPDQGLPGGPPGIWPGHPGHRPDQGLPGGGQPPGIWPQPPTAGQLPGMGGQGGSGHHPSHPIVIPPNGIGPGQPSHPIVIPPPGDMTKPVPLPPESGSGGGEVLPPVYPDQGLPGGGGHPDQGLPGGGGHRINYVFVWAPGIGGAWLYIGGRPDQGLPGHQPSPQPPMAPGGQPQPHQGMQQRR